MAVLPLSDLGDPRLEAFRVMRDGDLLRTRQLFVAEGRFIVERAIADGRFEVHAMLVNRASLVALSHSVAALPPDTPVFVADHDGFEQLTGFDVHRGCLALVRRPRELTVTDAVAEARLVVVLEGVTNADNVGSVFRSAAAFGAGAVLLSPTCCDPLYRKAIRTSMGAVLRVPSARAEPWPAALATLKDRGFTMVALSPREPAMTLDAFAQEPRVTRIALIVGTEGAGLTDAVEIAADVRVRIPITDAVDSLNLGVAAGIALSRLALAV